MLLKVVPVAVPTWVKLVQPAPAQRSTRYSVTPTLSVDAVQLRLIWVALAADAVSPDGVDGEVVSGAVGTIDVFMSAWMLAAVSARL